MKIGTIIKQKTVIILTAVILTIISFALARNALAMPPSAVTLVSFTVTAQNNAALLEWETATEFGTAGFAIFRKGTTGDFTDISGFLNAEGDGAAGAEYSYLDETAVNGQTYTYQLREYEAGGGDPIELEEVQITIGVLPTATPITVGGGSSNNPTATTASTNATSTPSATTAAGTSTATAQATAVFPTTVPTSRATAVSTSSSSDSTSNSSTSDPTPTTERTSTSSNPTATAVSSSNNAVVFAQGETPVPGAYPAEGSTAVPPVLNADYPANDNPVASETATPYPVTIEETTSINADSANNGPNVIGENATNNAANTDNTDESANSSTLYLWAGFLIAALIFIAGLIGTAVLFVRKK